jgi:hypothetical protein
MVEALQIAMKILCNPLEMPSSQPIHLQQPCTTGAADKSRIRANPDSTLYIFPIGMCFRLRLRHACLRIAKHHRAVVALFPRTKHHRPSCAA